MTIHAIGGWSPPEARDDTGRFGGAQLYDYDRGAAADVRPRRGQTSPLLRSPAIRIATSIACS